MTHRYSFILFAAILYVSSFSLEASEPPAKPPFPVGNLSAYPTVIQVGAKATLKWSIDYPAADPGTQYYNFIRQVVLPDMPVIEIGVGSSGETLSPLLFWPTGSRFELWTVDSVTLIPQLLESINVSPYMPMATLAIHSEDPYPYLPRTRADRAFQVEIMVNGVLSGEFDPVFSKSVNSLRSTQSYGATGTGAGLDRDQATLLTEASITTNGAQTQAYTVHSATGANPAKVRGEERFSIYSVADIDLPASLIDSATIQIWPLADAAITGIYGGQLIGPVMPEVTFTLNDLYPSSRTYAQVYQGSPQADVTGILVPGSTVVLNESIPGNRILTANNLNSVVDAAGLWTMEILTETPFGTDRLASVSFTVLETEITLESWRQFHFGTNENTGDAANLNDFDRDGLTNLIEYAFGLDPKQNSSGLLPVPRRVGSDQIISFTQASDVTGITYGAEWSTSLLPDSWQSIPDTGVFPEHSFRVPVDSFPMLYLRLKAISP